MEVGGEGVKRVALLLITLLVAVTLALSGQAAATTWYYAPNNAGTSGPVDHAWGTAWYTLFTLTSRIGGGSEKQGAYWAAPIISSGDAYINTWIWSYYPSFTPSASDYYTVTFDWYLNGYAQLENYWLPGPNGVSVNVGIYLVSYLYDATRGKTNWCQNRTVLSASNGLPGWNQYWTYSNSYYPLSCSIALLAGDHYYGTTYVKFYDEAAGFGLTIGTSDSITSLDVTQSRLTFYEYTGGGGCVLAGTSVLQPGNSTKAIEKLKKGDQVMAYDTATGILAPARVLGSTASYVSQIISFNDGLLRVTPTDQPLYVRNGSWQGWIRDPEDLTLGEQLFMPTTGTWANLTTIQSLQGNFKVYDLQVSAPNDFIANGFLVYDKT